MIKALLVSIALTVIQSGAMADDISILPSVDMRDLKSHEMEAARTDVSSDGKTVTWTSNAVDRPSVEKHNDTCARIPEYMDGMICYRMCGGSLKSQPTKWTVQWRPANFGDRTPWTACDEAHKCRGFNTEFYPGPARGCVHFGLWGAANRNEPQADLRAIINLQ